MLYFIRISTLSNRFEYNCYYVSNIVYTFIQENDVLLEFNANLKIGDLVYSSGGYNWKKFE